MLVAGGIEEFKRFAAIVQKIWDNSVSRRIIVFL